MATPLWRAMLVPAMFRGAPFHVDANARSSGRRIVLHEFPKRDVPYAEDMGRKARTFPVTGYVIGPSYVIQRELLEAALEAEGPGLLILPTLLQRDSILCQVRDYTVRETRQAGGMAEFDMQFVEAGEAGFSVNIDSQGASETAADNAESQAVDTSNSELKPGDGPGANPSGSVEIGQPTITDDSGNPI
jgi:prophage DNA circulation protein